MNQGSNNRIKMSIKYSELIEKPEGKTLEFKGNLSSSSNIIKTLTAFANTAGGILLIGIHDKTKRYLEFTTEYS